MENLSEHAAEVLAELDVNPAGNITKENLKKDKETGVYLYDDEAALKLVIDDASRADNYANINQWASQWTNSDMLLQSPMNASAFDGGNVSQANVPKYTLSNHLNTIVPKIMEGLFYEDPPFLLRPRPGTDMEVTRAKTALFSAQLWDMKFEEEVEYAFEEMALLGTTIFKWGYLEHNMSIRKPRRKANPVPMPGTNLQTAMLDSPDSDDFEIYID